MCTGDGEEGCESLPARMEDSISVGRRGLKQQTVIAGAPGVTGMVRVLPTHIRLAQHLLWAGSVASPGRRDARTSSVPRGAVQCHPGCT